MRRGVGCAALVWHPGAGRQGSRQGAGVREPTFIRHAASSLSSDICPGPTLKTPPPGICIAFRTCSSLLMLVNSSVTPAASPTKAPMTAPSAASLLVGMGLHAPGLLNNASPLHWR